jgi:hypothetical protein
MKPKRAASGEAAMSKSSRNSVWLFNAQDPTTVESRERKQDRLSHLPLPKIITVKLRP